MSAATRMANRGYLLIETLLSILGMAFLIFALVPSVTQDLVMGQVNWERQVASRFLETQLDMACDWVAQDTAVNFNGLVAASPMTLGGLPAELTNGSATRTAVFLDAAGNPVASPPALPTDLIGLTIQVAWVARGHTMNIANPLYLISRAGLCGDGG